MTNNTNTTAIGLDISNNYIKAIQLKKLQKKIRLTGAGKLPLEPGLFKDGEILKPAELAKAVMLVLNKPIFGTFLNRNINVSLTENLSFIKLIQIDKTPNNLTDIIEGEIEKNIPFALDEIYYDWQEINTDASTHNVIIVAAPKKNIEQYLSFFDALKMEVNAIETESIATCRALLSEEREVSPKSEKNYAIIDIGSSSSSIIIYSKGMIAFSLSISFSGNEITEKISRVLEVSALQAEKAKIILGFDPSSAKGIIASIAQENIDILLNRIKHALVYFEENFPQNGKVEKIILTGGGAYTKHLDNIIATNTGISTEKGLPMTSIEIKPDDLAKIFSESYKLDAEFFGKKNNVSAANSNLLSLKQESSLSFAVAIGLALRDLYAPMDL